MFFVRPLVALFIAQIFKIIIYGWKNKRFDFRRLVGAGGMPSSHAAFTVALTTQLGKDVGVDGPVFAIALVFTMVVLYDAAGVRRAAGKQAAILNTIMEEVMAHKKIEEARLKELLGHTPFEVLVGVVLGFLVGWW